MRGISLALGKHASKRIGQPSDIADVVSFLAAARSSLVTGQVVEASGGSVPTFSFPPFPPASGMQMTLKLSGFRALFLHRP
ncbi:MAG: SDR family oxidoreductase [Hyphomicrobium denitrificans]|nr:SDR family oxidoreductase [Hyphomicrobium denitrificans]MBN9291079.1 SDR family oxidoreductase [Hyphomicrobium denitrificans]MBN9353757.1 SDR family oxidoreductase [Hyphomicrobium denitrificans]